MNYKNRQEFEDYVKSLGYRVEFTDHFIVDGKVYHVESFHYNDDEGVYVGRDKFGCISLESVDSNGKKRILDFVITLSRGYSLTYRLYFLNDQEYQLFAGYKEDKRGNFILDENKERIPVYYNTRGTISEAGTVTLKYEETYLGAIPDNLYVFTYYGYKLIDQFLREQDLLSTDIKCVTNGN